jgi:hypothetical protein
MSSRRDTPDDDYVDDDDEIINQDAMDEDEELTPGPEVEDHEDEVRALPRPAQPAPCRPPGACPAGGRPIELPHTAAAQGAVPDEKREIARAERERLRLQEQQKKAALDRLREEENRSASKGEVGGGRGARDSCPTARQGPPQRAPFPGAALPQPSPASPRAAPRPALAANTPSPPGPPPRARAPARARPQASREQNRLQFLLKQAEIFQHFAPTGTLDKAKKQ